jgi:hypothetical protein
MIKYSITIRFLFIYFSLALLTFKKLVKLVATVSFNAKNQI